MSTALHLVIVVDDDVAEDFVPLLKPGTEIGITVGNWRLAGDATVEQVGVEKRLD